MWLQTWKRVDSSKFVINVPAERGVIIALANVDGAKGIAASYWRTGTKLLKC